MSVLKSRLRKLEGSMGRSAGRQIVVRSSQQISNEEMDAFLSSQGIVRTRDDQVLHLLTTYEDDPDWKKTAMEESGTCANPWVVPAPIVIRCAPILRHLG